MTVATERCWDEDVEKLSCKGSKNLEILQDSENKRYCTQNIIFILFKYDF